MSRYMYRETQHYVALPSSAKKTENTDLSGSGTNKMRAGEDEEKAELRVEVKEK